MNSTECTVSSVSTESREWISLAEACRLVGRSVSSVKSIAAAGGIRTDALPGCRLRYSRADAQRLAERLRSPA